MTRVRIVDEGEAFVKVLLLAGIPRVGEIICLWRRDATSGDWGNWHYRVNDVVYLETYRTVEVIKSCGVDLYVSRVLYGVWENYPDE